MSTDATASSAAIARHHALLATRARAYLSERLPLLPQHEALGPHLEQAFVAVVGAHALGEGGESVPMEIECVVRAAQAAWRPGQAGGPSDVLDPGVLPPVQVRVRSADWLDRQVAEPEGVWLHQRVAVVQDPDGMLPDALAAGIATLRRRLGGLVGQRYGWLRTGLDRSGGCADALASRMLVTRALAAALQLPLLARGEPFPPIEWLSWQVGRVCPQGEELVALCGRLAASPRVDRATAATLRRMEDDLLEAAGYGETLVRNYWSRA